MVELLLLLKAHNETQPEPHSGKKDDWKKPEQGGKYYRSLWASKPEVWNGTLVHTNLISTSKPRGYFNCHSTLLNFHKYF